MKSNVWTIEWLWRKAVTKAKERNNGLWASIWFYVGTFAKGDSALIKEVLVEEWSSDKKNDLYDFTY